MTRPGRLLIVAVVASLGAACGARAPVAPVTTPAAAEVAPPAPPVLATTAPAPVPTTTPPSPSATTPPAPSGTPRPPVAAADPAGLAEQLLDAEGTIRSEGPPPESLAAAGHLQQVTYRRLVTQPDWLEPVLTALPADLHDTVRANVAAGAALRSLVTPRDELPDWEILPPAPPEELLGYYREAEAAFGVPWQYLAAIHLVETRMGRIRGLSSAGARGPMQFIPSTWDAYGEGDIDDNRDAILAAGRYLRASGAPGDMARALYRYNPSQSYVEAVTAYAGQMEADPRTYLGYYHWQVYYLTTGGDVWLPVGWRRDG